jgi:hypothetical protein
MMAMDAAGDEDDEIDVVALGTGIGCFLRKMVRHWGFYLPTIADNTRLVD